MPILFFHSSNSSSKLCTINLQHIYLKEDGIRVERMVDLLNWTMQGGIRSIENDQGTTLCHEEEVHMVEIDLRSNRGCQSSLSLDDNSLHCCLMDSVEYLLLSDDGVLDQD